MFWTYKILLLHIIKSFIFSLTIVKVNLDCCRLYIFVYMHEGPLTDVEMKM